MLERDLIQTRGFHNIYEDGKPVGFEFSVRLTYYRGIYFSQLRTQSVTVDGVVYPKEQVRWELNGTEYTYEEMKDNSQVHWNPTETASVRIYNGTGLSVGYHEVSTGYKYSSSYMPPQTQGSIDDESVDPFLEMMFGQLHSTRKLLLVF